MTKNKKGGEKNTNNPESGSEETTTKDNIANKEKNVASDSFNKIQKPMVKDSDNFASDSQTIALSMEKSKKEGRHRWKSAPTILGQQPPTSAEFEGKKLDMFIDMDDDTKKLIAARISEIESKKSVSLNAKDVCKYKIIRSPSQLARENTSRTIDKNAHDYSRNKQATQGNTHVSVRPVENDNATGSDRKTLTQSAEKSKKKRNRRRGRTAPNTLATKSLNIVEYESHIFDHSNRDVDTKRLIDRISALEAGLTELENIKERHKCEIKSSSSPKGKRKITFNIGDENVPGSFKDEAISVAYHESKTFVSYRPVIFMTDKSTQTDPLPDSPSISRPTELKNISTLNSEADSRAMGEAAKSTTVLSPEEVETGSNRDSFDDMIATITAEYLREWIIENEKFVDDFMNCLEHQK